MVKPIQNPNPQQFRVAYYPGNFTTPVLDHQWRAAMQQGRSEERQKALIPKSLGKNSHTPKQESQVGHV